MYKKTIGIYHEDCLDGTVAAAVLLKKFPEIALFPLHHRYEEKDLEPILEKSTQETILYIVDFSLREEHYGKFIEKVGEVINIDHHIGAEEKLQKLDEKHENFSFVFDNDRSGASLTWIHFYGKENIPKIIQYTEDSDIWRFTYGDETRYAVAYLYQLSGKPEKLLELLNKGEDVVPEILANGKRINEYREHLTGLVFKKIRPLQIQVGDYVVPAINAPEFLRSEIGHELAQKLKKSIATFTINGDIVHVHFRGEKEHEPSALELAKLLDGGGHLNAAAATVKLKDFCGMIV